MLQMVAPHLPMANEKDKLGSTPGAAVFSIQLSLSLLTMTMAATITSTTLGDGRQKCPAAQLEDELVF
jgi:hypothetical protein